MLRTKHLFLKFVFELAIFMLKQEKTLTVTSKFETMNSVHRKCNVSTVAFRPRWFYSSCYLLLSFPLTLRKLLCLTVLITTTSGYSVLKDLLCTTNLNKTKCIIHLKLQSSVRPSWLIMEYLAVFGTFLALPDANY